MDFCMGLRGILPLLLLLVIIHDSVSPPVTQKKQGHEDNKVDEEEGDMQNELAVEYNRYLKEVVSALESDPTFKEKLEKAEEQDVRSGKIAAELEHVDHRVRNQLDEIKRTELERLRHLATKEFELRNGLDTDHLKIPEHLDHSNPHTFEIEDLRKLILKTTQDLEEADRKRREEFKEYEMQKEFEKQEKLKALDEEHKKQLLKEEEEKEKKHKQHEPLHHPGSKQQLEEVWEKQDHMDSQEFNPKTFFHLHDLDGNGVWDADEVKALFLKELDKMYTAGAAEDDMRERMEEMERMREHVFKEADTNKDGLISYEEFLAQTQKPEFEKDQGWEGLDEQQVYTQDEYKEFERRRQEEIQRLIAQGVLPPQPHGMPPHGYQQHPGQPQYQQQFPAQHHPGMPQGQMPHPGQQQYGHPQAQVYPNQGYAGQGQVHPGQVPQGQVHPGQVPQGHPGQGQVHPGQIPQGHPGQGQVHPGQVPQGHPGQGQPQGQYQGQGYQGQAPQGQGYQGQAPQGQGYQGQAPQGQGYQGQAPQGQGYQGQVPPAPAQPQQPPQQVPQAQPGQVPPSQAAPQQPPVQSAQQGQNINIHPLPNHPPQPIKQVNEPNQEAANNIPPQVNQIR